MPRTNDPLGILTGGGLAPPGSVSSSSISPGEVGPISGTLDAHVENPTGAHPATAISTVDLYDRYSGVNVQVSLDDLAALIPPSMGGVGSEGVAWLGSTNVGTPDWGILKLNDGALPFTGNVGADPHGVYPYYYRSPVCPTGVGLTGNGLEPATDPTFNVTDGVYTGGGVGKVHAGFVTTTIGGSSVGYPTWRILQAIANPAVVVSGIASPADRGVLALVKWPTGDEPTPLPAANFADIQARCVAAILLGKGVLDNGCDGEPGGIFTDATGGLRAVGTITVAGVASTLPHTVTLDLTALPGGPTLPSVFTAVGAPTTVPFEFERTGVTSTTAENLALAINDQFFPGLLLAVVSVSTITVFIRAEGTVGNSVTFATTASVPADYTLANPAGGTDVAPSPYNFPGRAAGQFNLDEIHTGVAPGTSQPFGNPAAGQVRLLTDPAAASFAPPTVVAGGLPIFGATNDAIGTTVNVPFLPFDLGGGTAGNFFAYRLPYLKDYSVASGLIYTPAAEKTRFTTKLAPASVGALTQAGDYDDFTTDFWGYQIARYRHRFTLAAGGAITRYDGNYALVHFKKEAYFEAYVRDGVVPASDQVYSVNLVQWTGNTTPYDQLENLVTATTPPAISPANSVNRAEVVEDNDGATLPALAVGALYTLNVAGPAQTVFYSGVEYYVPVDRSTASAPNVSITALTFTVTGAQSMFEVGYRSHDTVPTSGPLSSDNRRYALNQNMAFVSLSPYSYGGTESPTASGVTSGSPLATVFPGELGQFRRQRVELGYADLTTGSVDPAISFAATYTFNAATKADGMHFTGDYTTPSFTADARVRVFFRRPLVVDGGTGYPLPATTLGFDITSSISPGRILYHSMLESTTSLSPKYGNTFALANATLDTDKDVSERFLDEVYRYPENWTPLTVPADVLQLQGPGLPSGPLAIQVPVRPILADPDYPGWFFQSLHTSVLINGAGNLGNALQVAGLPARNPPYTDGLDAPFPSRGILLYPQTDYSIDDPPGPNYFGLTGDRVYVRAFDAGAANAGTSTVTFRLWGVDLTDFQYAALTAPGATGMAVMVKVPGLTTWMDAGRADGSGPSKQDIALDGAGCLVTSASLVDAVSQLHYTDITVNLSPAALFLNGEGKCPVLVKVIIKYNPTGLALNFVGGGETAATNTLRGLVGIEINP
jgi:hypothetical protein